MITEIDDVSTFFFKEKIDDLLYYLCDQGKYLSKKEINDTLDTINDYNKVLEERGERVNLNENL